MFNTHNPDPYPQLTQPMRSGVYVRRAENDPAGEIDALVYRQTVPVEGASGAARWQVFRNEIVQENGQWRQQTRPERNNQRVGITEAVRLLAEFDYGQAHDTIHFSVKDARDLPPELRLVFSNSYFNDVLKPHGLIADPEIGHIMPLVASQPVGPASLPVADLVGNGLAPVLPVPTAVRPNSFSAILRRLLPGYAAAIKPATPFARQAGLFRVNPTPQPQIEPLLAQIANRADLQEVILADARRRGAKISDDTSLDTIRCAYCSLNFAVDPQRVLDMATFVAHEAVLDQHWPILNAMVANFQSAEKLQQDFLLFSYYARGNPDTVRKVHHSVLDFFTPGTDHGIPAEGSVTRLIENLNADSGQQRKREKIAKQTQELWDNQTSFLQLKAYRWRYGSSYNVEIAASEYTKIASRYTMHDSGTDRNLFADPFLAPIIGMTNQRMDFSNGRPAAKIISANQKDLEFLRNWWRPERALELYAQQQAALPAPARPTPAYSQQKASAQPLDQQRRLG